MSTENFKSFAVVGPGASTEFIIDELLRQRQTDSSVSVRILTRPTSKPHAKAATWTSLGATFHPVTHEPSHPSLLDALKDADVVISGLGIEEPFDQAPLALASREAGAKLFLPFEVGADEYIEDKGTCYTAKVAFRRWLDGEGGWKGKWIRLHTGWYTDAIISEYIGFDIFDANIEPSFTIWGDGNAPISYTSRPSIGAFLGYVLAQTPKSRLIELASNSSTNALRLDGGRLTTNELLKLCLSLMKDKNVPITRIPHEELASMDQRHHRNDMLTVYDAGLGVTGPVVGGNWKEWRKDSWRPESVEEVVREKLRKCGRLAGDA